MPEAHLLKAAGHFFAKQSRGEPSTILMDALFDGGGGGVGNRRSKTDTMYLFVALTFAIFFFHPVSLG